MGPVSILIFLDNALEGHDFLCLLVGINVSILIFLDNALEDQNRNNMKETQYAFQS